jgi:transposase
MTWTPEHRRRYAPAIDHVVRANAVARLAAIVDAIDPPARTGRPRLWSTLVMLQALWWLCRAGSAWRLLPEIYPPRQTIGSRLERWVERGALERAPAVLNGCLRLARGRKRRPSAGILDTQSVKTGPQRGPRGYDAAKGVKGRKRVLLVDTEGLMHAIQIVPASVQDRDTPAVIEPELAGSSLLKVWADLGFGGDAATAPMIRCGIDLELVGRAQEQGRVRGRAQALAGRGNLRGSWPLPAAPGRPRGQHDHATGHDPARRPVHDRQPLRAPDQGVSFRHGS